MGSPGTTLMYKSLHVVKYYNWFIKKGMSCVNVMFCDLTFWQNFRSTDLPSLRTQSSSRVLIPSPHVALGASWHVLHSARKERCGPLAGEATCCSAYLTLLGIQNVSLPRGVVLNGCSPAPRPYLEPGARLSLSIFDQY